MSSEVNYNLQIRLSKVNNAGMYLINFDIINKCITNYIYDNEHKYE